MPRDLNGNYTLPAGNPVAGGTVIESDWANTTMADLANEIQDSLSRSGKGGLLVPFKFASGTVSNPGITWNLDTATGRYLFDTNDQRDVVNGTDVLRMRPSNLDFYVDAFFSNATTFAENVSVTAAAPTDPSHLVRKDYVDGTLATDYVSSTTDTDVSANTEWQDTFGVQFGDNGDCRIAHDGTDTNIDINSGLLNIAAKFSFDPAGIFSVTGTIEATGGIDKVTDQNGGTLQNWSGTQAQYDALTPDPNTLYFIEE